MNNSYFEGVLKKMLILSVFVLVFGTFGGFVNAEDNEDDANKKSGIPEGGLQLSPTKFIWTLKDGESRVEKINVKNYSEITQKVSVEVEDFFVGPDGSEPKFFVPDDNHPRKARDVIDWITPPEDFILQPGEGRWVEFSVNVPEEQPTNGYYGGILFRSGGMTEDEGSRIGISYRVGALIIMAVQGDEPMKKTAEFKEFYPVKSVFWESPAILIAKIMNTGNIHFPMFGEITVNKFNKKFHVIELKPQLIYPDIERSYTEKIMFSWLDFGKYNAHLSMWSEDGSIKFEEDTSFWVIPWKGLMALIAGIVVVWLLMKLFRKYVHIGSKPQKRKRKK